MPRNIIGIAKALANSRKLEPRLSGKGALEVEKDLPRDCLGHFQVHDSFAIFQIVVILWWEGRFSRQIAGKLCYFVRTLKGTHTALSLLHTPSSTPPYRSFFGVRLSFNTPPE